MNIRETAIIMRGVRALCPAQKFDELSPEMWEAVLARTPFDDARAAIVILGGELPFIAPSDVVKQVRKARTERARRLPMPCPNTVPGVAEGDEIRAIETAMADGLITTLAQIYAYERWGGSLYLARMRGHMPILEGPEPGDHSPIQLPRMFGDVPDEEEEES